MTPSRCTIGRLLSVLNLCSAGERDTMHVKSEVVALAQGGVPFDGQYTRPTTAF